MTQKKRKPSRQSRRGIWLLIVMVLLGGLYTLWQGDRPAAVTALPEGTLEVHFLDVGQGDAALICCGDAAMLIDGGNPEDGSYVAGYLEGMGISALDALVCTHPDRDHCGGLTAVAEEVTVRQAYCCETVSEERTFQSFAAALGEQAAPLSVPTPGTAFALGEAQVTFLWPFALGEEDNNNSLVLRIDFGETSFLFTGDLESDGEADLMASGMDVRAAVLKVGHHGSRYSTGEAFLDAVQPEIAVISVGADNSYGHPHGDTLARLTAAGAEILRTDECGTVVLQSDGKTVTRAEAAMDAAA